MTQIYDYDVLIRHFDQVVIHKYHLHRNRKNSYSFISLEIYFYINFTLLKLCAVHYLPAVCPCIVTVATDELNKFW